MDFQINGILYLNKDVKLIENKNYELLLNWIIFKEQPSNDDEIEKIKVKADLFIKEEIQGLNYLLENNENEKQTFKIPEIYTRYKDLLNNIVE